MSKSPNTKGTAVFAGQLTQTGVDVDTWLQIPTGIDPGSNTVLELESMEILFRNANTNFITTFEQHIRVGISRSTVLPSLANVDCFGMLELSKSSVSGVAGVGTITFIDTIQSIDLEPSITIQPYLYISIETLNFISEAVIDYRITYSTSKATQSEILLLLASGA